MRASASSKKKLNLLMKELNIINLNTSDDEVHDDEGENNKIKKHLENDKKNDEENENPEPQNLDREIMEPDSGMRLELRSIASPKEITTRSEEILEEGRGVP